MKLKHPGRPFLFATAALLAASMLPARAQTTLRMADSLPAGHIIHQVLTKPFIDAVDKASRGQVRILHFPGEQLGKAKDMLALTQSGVTDIGYIGPSYASDKMPLSSALELPGAFSDYCQGSRTLWALTHDGGYLETHEFAPNHIVVLITFMLPSYQVLLGNGKNVQSLKDLAGMKIRSGGGAMDFMLKDLDMVPVRMTPPEIYEALSRGTVDGALLPYESAVSYGVATKLKSGTNKENFGSVVLTYGIGDTRWKQLPEGVRATLMQAGRDVSLGACTGFQKAEDAAYDKTKAMGMKTIVLGAADKKDLATAFAKASNEWAASVDKRGKPGTETLAAVRKALAEAKP